MKGIAMAAWLLEGRVGWPVDAIVIAVIPWRHVVRQYVLARGEGWR